MKNLIFILLFTISAMNGQTDSDKKFALSTGYTTNLAMGDNFINKAYGTFSGYNIEFSAVVIKDFSAGLQFTKSKSKVIDKSLFGDFDSGKSFKLIPFIAYRQKLGLEKFIFQHKIGFGITEIANESPFGKYKVTGSTFLVGTKVNYKLYHFLHLYLSTDFAYSKFKVDIQGPYKNFYQKGIEILPSVGLSYQFGN